MPVKPSPTAVVGDRQLDVEAGRFGGAADHGVQVAQRLPHHVIDGRDRQDRGHAEALVERAHDRLALAEPDEIGADDRGQDADAADDQRQAHQRQHLLGAGADEQGDQHHGGADGDDIGLEQIGGHAGAVADIVADIVGDHGRVAGIVLGDAGLDLADQVGADVGGLGEDAAAETREDRDQRGAEGEATSASITSRVIGRDGPGRRRGRRRRPRWRAARGRRRACR